MGDSLSGLGKRHVAAVPLPCRPAPSLSVAEALPELEAVVGRIRSLLAAAEGIEGISV